jgi:ribosomal-protein-alanine N-acetyltransferase
MTDAIATIREMAVADIDAVAAIEKAVFSDPWPKSAFREMLKEESRINRVLVMPDGEIGGYVIAQIAGDELQIQNIAVSPPHRRHRLGKLLLESAEEVGLQRGALCSVLDVRSGNDAALGLYHSFGYRMIGRRKNYYRNPVCDALVLFRRLDEARTTDVTREPGNGMVS